MHNISPLTTPATIPSYWAKFCYINLKTRLYRSTNVMQSILPGISSCGAAPVMNGIPCKSINVSQSIDGQ